MAKYTFGMRTTIAGTSALPNISIYAVAASGFRLREVGLFNTTSTALAVALARLTTTGTQGAGQTEGEYDNDGPAPAATIFAGHTAGPTLGQILRQASLGASIGSGIIWTFPDPGIVVASGTANGLGIIVPTGTGQILDVYFDWEE